ncbi:30S ribosomal protein S9 [Leifsonia xyli subsp. cynodontis DSM 46306]|uniref:Uncharacterized protein n=1 Tax=Leifsonia xyli subsp. cynodontis DSM 46306 TaxID=1389489 RepID=U3P8D8_LEIXC|nr:30S ribosomal protein S9 [Leifsonia xyli subsp. cynodontis DSM 46306]
MAIASAVRWCLIFSIVRLFGVYEPSRGFATTPSRPAPSNSTSQRLASSTSVVARVTRTGSGSALAKASSAARRSENGRSRRDSSPSAIRSKAMKVAGVCSDSRFTRLAAGWMRWDSASQSRR